MPRTFPHAVNPWRVLARAIWAQIIRDHTVGMHFLKCDRKGCPHMEFHNALDQRHVGKPCPRCGDSLLTQADADAWTNTRRAL